MQYFKKLILSIILSILFIPLVKAASGNISVSGVNQVVSGNKLTVTVTISSSTPIGSWQMNLNYDKNYLQLLSSNSEAGGTMMANSSATGVTKRSYTYSFKTLKTGSTTISVTSALAYAFSDLSQINLSTGSKTVKIISQAELEASYSKDNNLKSLSVEGYDITPIFDKDVLEYSVVVPEDVKEIHINAAAKDAKASVSGTGVKEVSLGSNSFDIIVRAENGSEKAYKLKVEVKDNNPIEIVIDDKTYTLVKIRDYLESPIDFVETTVNVEGIEIPSFKNDNINVMLVGLKDSDGNISLFKYDSTDNSYSKYVAIKTNTFSLMPMEAPSVPKGYEKHSETIDDEKIIVYKYTQASRYSLIYGIDLTTGEKGFFMYDTKLKSLISYNTELIDQLQSQNQLFIYIILAFGILVLILFIMIVSILKKKKKIKFENDSNKKNKRNKDEEMVQL